MKAATSTSGSGLQAFSISIHAAREGGDDLGAILEETAEISIHAAREGGDQEVANVITHKPISIHAAREGGDL